MAQYCIIRKDYLNGKATGHFAAKAAPVEDDNDVGAALAAKYVADQEQLEYLREEL